MAEEPEKVTNGSKQEDSAEMMTRRAGDDALEMGFGNGESFALLQRVATMFSKSSLVPQAYQGNLPNCVIALNMAARLRADPLMVMQNLYIVYNRPAWSAQFLIATLNQNGGFSKLRYEWQGEKGDQEWGCRAWAIDKATNEKLYGTWITWKLANDEGWVNKNGSKWKTMPEQMFVYRAGAWFVKAYAPELSMGLPTAEEMLDVQYREVTPGVFEPEFAPPERTEPEVEEKPNGAPVENLKASLKKKRNAAAKPPVQEEAEPADTNDGDEDGEEIIGDETKPSTREPGEEPEEGETTPEDSKRADIVAAIERLGDLNKRDVAADVLELYGEAQLKSSRTDEETVVLIPVPNLANVLKRLEKKIVELSPKRK